MDSTAKPDRVTTAADGRRIEVYGRDSITPNQLAKVFAKIIEEQYNAQRRELRKEYAVHRREER